MITETKGKEKQERKQTFKIKNKKLRQRLTLFSSITFISGSKLSKILEEKKHRNCC